MNRGLSSEATALIAGIGIGAALMYFLDPDGGARRRALVRDRTASSLGEAGRQLRDRSVDARNRARGAAAELRHRGDDNPSDDLLVARVRAELGHHVVHTGAIQVSAAEGAVTLRGPVLREELEDVLSTARAVRGVRHIDNQLEVHESAAGISALQGQP